MTFPYGDSGAHAVITLRMINTIISEHPSPSSIPFIISQLYMTPVLEICASLSTSSQYTGDRSEGSALLHRFKARVSSLLQSKSPTDKWSGIALAKVAMESSFECLASSGEVWVRLMVPILTKPEPPPVTNYAIATLTRVFTVLTVGKPTLIRQIVSPNLPTTIGHVLNILRPVNSSTSDAMPSEGTLATALESLKDLLCHNPVTFRPFTQRTQEISLSVLSPQCGLSKLGRLAGDLFVSLHLSDTTPRGGGGIIGIAVNEGGGSSPGNKVAAAAESWTRTVKSVISEIDELFNVILRCTAEGHPAGTARRNSSTEVSGASTIGLDEWKGISKGFDRAEMLLRLLSRFLSHPTSSQVVIPLGQLVGLTGRLAGLPCKAAQSNPAIERPERETVVVRLSSLKCCALNLLSSAIERLGRMFAPLANLVIEQLAAIYSEHRSDTGIRTAVYTLLTALLNLFGPALGKQTVASVHPILSSLYTDLVLNADEPKNPPPAKLTGKRGSSRNAEKQKEVHADSFLSPSSWLNSRPMWLRGLISAAEGLLVAVLGKLPPTYIRSQMRRLLDRAAIFTMNEKAMMASALFPSTAPNGNSRGGSILPHLVGASRGNLAVEGIVRPRLPVLWVGRASDVEVGEEEEAEGDDEEVVDEEERCVAVNHKTNPAQLNNITEKPGTKRSIWHSQDTDPSPKRQRSYTQTPPLHSPPALGPVPAPAQGPRPVQVASTAHTTLDYTFIKTTQQTIPEVQQPQLTPTATSVPLSTPTTTTTTALTRHTEAITENARLEAVDSDDEMIIPEIDMGESSDDDDESQDI